MNLPASIAALPGRTAELVDLLELWANINSGSGHHAGLDRMRAALRAAFAQAFCAAQIEEPECKGTVRALRVIMRPQARSQILLSGHFDTVYEADGTCVTPSAPDLLG